MMNNKFYEEAREFVDNCTWNAGISFTDRQKHNLTQMINKKYYKTCDWKQVGKSIYSSCEFTLEFSHWDKKSFKYCPSCGGIINLTLDEENEKPTNVI